MARHGKRLWRSVAVATALVLGLAACGDDNGSGGGGTTTESAPYRLLVIVATSGPAAGAGNLTVNAAKVAADKINATGGVNGRKVEIVVADDGADPTKSVSVLQSQLQGDKKPDAVYAGLTSDTTLAMLPILTSRKIMNIGTTASAAIGDASKYPYTFRPTAHTETFTDWVAAAAKAKGAKTVGVLTPTTAIGNATAASYTTSFKNAGITQFAETYNATDQDFTAHVQRLAANKPDVVVFNAGVATIPPLIVQAREKLGVTTPYYADYCLSVDLAKLATPAQLKGVGLASYKLAIKGSSAKQSTYDSLITDLKKYGPISSYLVNPSLAYDAVMLLKVGADQAKSTDPDKMKSALESLSALANVFLTYGSMKFTATDHFSSGVNADQDYGLIDAVGPQVDGQYTAATG